MSIPIKIVFDWEKMRICRECGKKLAGELLKHARSGQANVDIPKLLCDDCWNYNISIGGIKAEIDPRVIRE